MMERWYLVQTENQHKALEYVNNLDIVNYSFITSGHSKGGDLAQYVALFATDTLIDTSASVYFYSIIPAYITRTAT